MAIKIWTTDIQKCFVWTTPVKSIWSWDTQVRPSGWWGWQPWANTLLYVPMKSDLDDHSGNNVSMTNNWVVIENWFWKFNWTSSYIYTTNNFSLASTPFTVSFWMNVNSINTSWLIWHNLYSSGYKWWNMYIVNSKIRSEFTPNWWKIWTNTINVNQWMLVTLTADSSWRTLYKDWTQVSTWSSSITFIATSLYMGCGSWTSTPDHFYNGYMSNVIIEDKVRTAQEVADYYNLTKSNYWL